MCAPCGMLTCVECIRPQVYGIRIWRDIGVRFRYQGVESRAISTESLMLSNHSRRGRGGHWKAERSEYVK